MTNHTFLLALDDSEATLEKVGGKGQATAQMAALNLSLPPGFYLTTAAYRHFVNTNQLHGKISDLLKQGEGAGAEIRALFAAGEMPADIAAVLQDAYAALGSGKPAVAVRSSATAEDLPGMSFAGQQDTYLNVQGSDHLTPTVINCWASLWTDRAISYRERMGIAHDQVSMAVLVQEMVPAEVSGILFTANPQTGERTEMVINASYGLGEAIVSGQITPDTYVVDRNPGTIKETFIGSKESKIVPGSSQGTTIERVSDTERRQPALSEEWVQKLVEEGEKIERHFESPQDIEWALADDRLWILQSRPITNLPPAPLKNVIWESATTGEKLIRRQVVEHMPGPLSPLFDDLYLSMGMDRSMDEFLESFGIHFDLGLMINRPFFKTVNGYAYSSASYKFNIKIVWMILQAYTKMLPKLLFNAVPRWRDEQLPAYLTTIEMWKTLDFSQEPDQQLWAGIQRLTTADAIYWFEVSIILGLAKVSDNLLHSFLTKQGKGLTSGLFLRGYPSKTLEAQLDLEQIADQIREDEAIKNLVLNTPAAEFLERLDELPSADGIVEAIDIFFDQYGHQIYSLDFVEPTQQEDAVPVLVGLKNLVENQSASAARQKKLAAERESLIESTARSFGPWKRWKFRRLVNFARKYAPYREDALFFIGAAWPTVRRIAHELGQRFVDRGIIQAPEDIYYLTAAEVEQALAGEGSLLDFRRRARERFELREARKRLQPPPKIPDVPFKLGPIDMSIFETQKQNEREGNHLKGFAVSPGKITAPASVILTPADFEKMKPGTILVCPTTTPAWTPLFSQAAGLVTEIGGILAHGSIVAREYGIPAVMGLTDITQEIQDGQLITVDGDVGRVSLN